MKDNSWTNFILELNKTNKKRGLILESLPLNESEKDDFKNLLSFLTVTNINTLVDRFTNNLDFNNPDYLIYSTYELILLDSGYDRRYWNLSFIVNQQMRSVFRLKCYGKHVSKLLPNSDISQTYSILSDKKNILHKQVLAIFIKGYLAKIILDEAEVLKLPRSYTNKYYTSLLSFIVGNKHDYIYYSEYILRIFAFFSLPIITLIMTLNSSIFFTFNSFSYYPLESFDNMLKNDLRYFIPLYASNIAYYICIRSVFPDLLKINKYNHKNPDEPFLTTAFFTAVAITFIGFYSISSYIEDHKIKRDPVYLLVEKMQYEEAIETISREKYKPYESEYLISQVRANQPTKAPTEGAFRAVNAKIVVDYTKSNSLPDNVHPFAIDAIFKANFSDSTYDNFNTNKQKQILFLGLWIYALVQILLVDIINYRRKS